LWTEFRPGALSTQEVTEHQCTDRSENEAFFATFFTRGASAMGLDAYRSMRPVG